jgi:ribonuclease BN (tRNA processing enzyme)
VTVLGKSPAWQDSDAACSGYLVEHQGYSLLLDCGSGVFAKLRQARDYLGVDAVVISHLHPDHFFDLIPFATALNFGPRTAGDPHRRRPPLVTPVGSSEVFHLILSCWHSQELIDGAFAVQEYDEADELELGPFAVRFCEVPHYVLTFAVELRQADGSRFTFGADCAPSPDLERFAQQTDLLLLEATLTKPEPEHDRGHLTPTQAGELARRARARRTVLTHFSDELDEQWLAREAAEALGGPVELAREGLVLEIGE